MTALSGDARERLAEVAWGVLVASWRDGVVDQSVIAHAIAGNLLPVVAELADLRAAEELERLADERVWTTEHDNEVVSVRDLYEQIARLRGELEPVTFDFPPGDDALTSPTAPEGDRHELAQAPLDGMEQPRVRHLGEQLPDTSLQGPVLQQASAQGLWPVTADDPRPAGEACPVNRTVYGRPCDGPGTYYCDSEVWGSACRRYFEDRPAASGGATDGERDDREPKPCPRCGQTCTYDGWDHVHRSGLGIGSCAPVASQADGELRKDIAHAVFGAGHSYAAADAVLALPAVRQLLADGAAVRRVRELTDHLLHNPAYDKGTVRTIRRALDGDRP